MRGSKKPVEHLHVGSPLPLSRFPSDRKPLSHSATWSTNLPLTVPSPIEQCQGQLWMWRHYLQSERSAAGKHWGRTSGRDNSETCGGGTAQVLMRAGTGNHRGGETWQDAVSWGWMRKKGSRKKVMEKKETLQWRQGNVYIKKKKLDLWYLCLQFDDTVDLSLEHWICILKFCTCYIFFRLSTQPVITTCKSSHVRC